MSDKFANIAGIFRELGDFMAKRPRSVLLLNGPNLNLLGQREPELYGHVTLADIVDGLTREADALSLKLSSLQSNAEHELVERVHAAAGDGTGCWW